MKPRGLGRGLGAILPVEEAVIERSHAVQEIPIDAIEPNPYQPRLDFSEEDLEELAESIRQHGLIQPITVRAVGEKYQIIAGERRWRAAKRAGLLRIPAYVRTADNTQLLAFALIENVQRQNLNPIELALAYKRLIEECNLTQEEVAQYVGKSRPAVANTLRLLRLPPEIQKALKEGTIAEGHVRPLLALDSPELQLQVFHEIQRKGLNARQVEALVQQLTTPKPKKPAKAPSMMEIHLAELAKNLTYRFHAPVEIKGKPDGSGELRIRYSSPEDLERLLGLFGVQG
ncbi:MAG: ParB/RepB/Spo0J family partition protein [Bacteroidia bacterium]|nr:ParB/RepB/Spo0J family partition protein [Bacteroidia bacterium]MCX7763709.1 ParB/RepB/Spo0J family partition protein [Bacteroidia bacterium]MDW8057615.1 ParB/RepB/Spo0J family partition protein [Bacteroidia bacterium]